MSKLGGEGISLACCTHMYSDFVDLAARADPAATAVPGGGRQQCTVKIEFMSIEINVRK